ncbi:hypothetical protein ARMSODRAFT_958493, partial [Armillaria solidipes]
MISFRYTLDLSRELARDTRWHEEVTMSVKALEAEVDKLNKKYNAAMKRVANQESSIVSGRVKENRRHAVVVPSSVADVIQRSNEVSAD